MVSEKELKIYLGQDERILNLNKRLEATFKGVDKEGFILMELPYI